MKRLLCICLALMLVLAGCSSQKTQEQPKLILRYADNQPEGYPTTIAAEYFAKLVEERTNGEVVIRVYSDGALGSESSVFEQVQFGGIDLTRISLGTLSEYYPEAEVLQLPYLYDDAEHMWRVLDGEIGEDFLSGAEQAGVSGLSWFDAGARSFYTTEPLTCLKDLQGRRIRVQESEFMSRMVELLGATAVQMPYGDVYSALQTGKVDGAENNWPSYSTGGHFAAAPYYLRDEHSRLPEMQIISIAAMEKIAEIDEAYPAVIRECAKESALYERELWSETETEAEDTMKAQGCVVTELDRKELKKFREAVQPMYEDYDAELIQKIRES